MQQYPVKSDTHCHDHRISSSVSNFLVEKACSGAPGDSSIHRQKWTPHLHHRRTRNPRRSQVPQWETPSQWWSHLSWYWSNRGNHSAMAAATNGITNDLTTLCTVAAID